MKAPSSPFQKYSAWLSHQPLSEHTRRAYRSRIKRFESFLEASGETIQALAENDRELAHVLKNHKRHLKQVDKASPATVNAHLTTIEHFLQSLGSKLPEIGREVLPQVSPRAIDKEEQARFLRAAAGCRRSLDRAVLHLLFFSGIRLGECAALEVDDAFVVGQNRKVVVRNGKGDFYREIPLNTEAAESVRMWLKDRTTKYAEKETDTALFLNPQGNRISTASLDLIVRKVGKACGLSLSAHTLRHTLLTNLVRNGKDLVLVAEIGGHKRLETTQRHTLPSVGDKQRAMEGLIS